MQYIQTLLDNRIPLKLIQIAEGESVIFCKKFKEELFDSGFFSTKEKDFVHNYVTENNQKYIVTNVSFPDGHVENNVKFRVAISENADVPFSIYAVKNTPKTLINENIKTPSHHIIQKEKNDQSFHQARLMEHQILLEKKKLLKEQEELKKEKQIVENEKIVANKLDSYKQKLFEEFLTVSENQKNYIRDQIEEKFKNIEFKFINEANSFKKISEKILEQLKNKNSESIQKTVEEKIQNKYEEIEKYLLENREVSSQLLVEKTDELKKLFDEKLILDLQQYKQNLISEIQNLAEKNVEKFIDDNKTKFGKNIEDYFTKKLEQLTEVNKHNSSLVNEAKSYTDKQITRAIEDSKNYAKRILDLGGGGGSNAVQFANGGTMNGNLNVYGHILSGGKNISDYFGSGGGGNTSVDSVVIGNSANWTSVYNTVKSLSDSWEESAFISPMQSASASWNSVYLTVQSFSAYWQTAFGSITANP